MDTKNDAIGIADSATGSVSHAMQCCVSSRFWRQHFHEWMGLEGCHSLHLVHAWLMLAVYTISKNAVFILAIHI